MENQIIENCQTCLRPTLEPGATQKTQWISVCRCDRPYAPNSQFSIDVCANCKRRVAANALRSISRKDLCSCASPAPKKVATYIKQNEKDAVALDLAEVGLTDESFPVDRYAPIAFLGESSKAVMLLARDRTRGTKVALKCFKRMNAEAKRVFEQEAKKNKQLTHTNIAKVVDVGIHNGKAPYLVTEYKDGFNLEQCVDIYGTPSYDVAVACLLGACEALLYAQKQTILHRDIRPGNIIFVDDMNSEPLIVVTDFALPTAKANEELIDPPDAMYLSGDEARNMEFTEKSEVYSLGSVGYLLLTGRAPFSEGTARDIKNSHALKLAPRISRIAFDAKRPTDLEEVIERCMEKDPNVRFDSVAKLQERLEVFPRRVQAQIAIILAAKKRKKMMQYLIAGGAGLAVISVIALLVLGAH